MSSAICFNLDQSEILSFANGLKSLQCITTLDLSELKSVADNNINVYSSIDIEVH